MTPHPASLALARFHGSFMSGREVGDPYPMQSPSPGVGGSRAPKSRPGPTGTAPSCGDSKIRSVLEPVPSQNSPTLQNARALITPGNDSIFKKNSDLSILVLGRLWPKFKREEFPSTKRKFASMLG